MKKPRPACPKCGDPLRVRFTYPYNPVVWNGVDAVVLECETCGYVYRKDVHSE